MTSPWVLEVCFPPDRMTGASVVEFLELLASDVVFERISVMLSLTRSHHWKFSGRNVDRVRALGAVRTVEFEGPGVRLTVSEDFHMTRVSLTRPGEIGGAVLRPILSMPDMNLCLIGDLEDRTWQSTRWIEYYERDGRDYSHLPLIGTPPDQRLDISGNPGRWDEFPGLVLWSAARMWLGPLALARFGGVENVLAFPDVPVRLVGGLVEVELFDVDDPVEVIRARQRAFRDWVGMDELAADPQRYRPIPGDTFMTVDREVVEGVERTVLVQWFDADGDLVVRSKAHFGRRAVITDDGVWLSTSEIEP